MQPVVDIHLSGYRRHVPTPPGDLAAAVEVGRRLQDRWTLGVIAALFEAPLGFNDLQRAAGGPGATTLRARLRRLEGAGLVDRHVLSARPPRTRYSLSDAGLALRPALDAMARCGPPRPEAVGCHTAPETDGAAAMQLLAERWTLPIMLVLAERPLGFNDLRRAVGAANSATLTKRLDALLNAGLLERTVLATFPPRTSYAITDAAAPFSDVLRAIRVWVRAHGGADQRVAAGHHVNVALADDAGAPDGR